MMLAFLVRCARVIMLFLNPLITAVAQTFSFLLKGQATALEQSKIMHPARAKSGGHNTLIGLLHYHLRFVRVALFLPL